MNARAKQLHDEALSLKPDGVEHDAILCPFCLDSASSTSENPSGSGQSDEAENQKPDEAMEGGTKKQMDTITLETHELKLNKAVADAVAAKDAEIATLNKALETATADKAGLTEKVTTLTEENTRLNGELDSAQVQLKTATDEVAKLQVELTAKDEAARLAELASQRVEQVKNLGLFQEDYIAEKASAWAQVDDAAWTERVEEWSKLKGQSAPPAPTTETASAMTGTNEDAGDTNTERTARRAVLGLV